MVLLHNPRGSNKMVHSVVSPVAINITDGEGSDKRQVRVGLMDKPKYVDNSISELTFTIWTGGDEKLFELITQAIQSHKDFRKVINLEPCRRTKSKMVFTINFAVTKNYEDRAYEICADIMRMLNDVITKEFNTVDTNRQFAAITAGFGTETKGYMNRPRYQ